MSQIDLKSEVQGAQAEPLLPIEKKTDRVEPRAWRSPIGDSHHRELPWSFVDWAFCRLGLL